MEPAQFQKLTVTELRRLAREQGIKGASRMVRASLIAALIKLTPGPSRTTPAKTSRTPPPKLAARPRPGRASLDIPSSTRPTRPAEQDPQAMARRYFEQGLADRAAEIYRTLLALDPENTQLRTRLAEAEAALRGHDKGTAAPPPPAESAIREPLGLLDLEEPPQTYGVDECELLARDPYHVFAYWEITERSLAGARRQLGDEGGAAQLTLRIFLTSGTERGGIARETRDHVLGGLHGRRYLPAPKSGVVVRAAVGLVSPSGLFAPIANSSAVRIPPAEPAPATPDVEWLEVVPPMPGSRERAPIEIRHGRPGERPLPPAPTSPPPGSSAAGAPPWPRRRGSSS